LAVPGKHNVANGLAAAATAIAMGRSLTDIKAGLEQFGGVQGRLALKEGSQGSRLIDDTYNANLGSVKAAIDMLAQSAGQKIFVLGELGEVGEALNDHYEQIGLYARQKKIDNFFTCGKASQKASDVFESGGSHFSEKQALIEAIRPILAQHVTVLVKGSRSAQMEQVIKGLMG
jgi:UDP-N-acetylmuramoyl-tripeptide--D-alanyl-D-alanine ligase